MSYSKNRLYQLGEPLGYAVTRMEGGRMLLGGGGSKSSSSSASTTTNTDKRIAIESGIGISSDSSTVTVQALDAGIVAKALDTVAAADATSGEGFDKLLGLADKLFTGAGEIITKTQDTTLAQLETINTAANDQSGTIDQKTMIILAIAGAAAIVLPKLKG